MKAVEACANIPLKARVTLAQCLMAHNGIREIETGEKWVSPDI